MADEAAQVTAASSSAEATGLADALGLGSAQLQTVSNTVATIPAQAVEPPKPEPLIASPAGFTSPAIQSGPTKLFVGSIPAGTTREQVTEEFGKHGQVAEVFVKTDQAQAGRMWGFVTYAFPEGATAAVAALNEQMVFPNALGPLTVSFARSSSAPPSDMSGSGGASFAPAAVNPAMAPAAGQGPTKLFVGSIPAGTTKEQLIEEFGKYGSVMDVFLKEDRSEPLRMWGFVTYDSSAAAAAAVAALHERLVLPGGSRPCAVNFARNSQAQHSMAAQSYNSYAAPSAKGGSVGGTKLFLGSIPIGTTDAALRLEFEKFGQVTDIFLKNDNSDPSRMWGFLSYADPQAAAVAVSALHEKLMMPGSVRPLAVSFARQSGGKGGAGAPAPPMPPAGGWKVYYTADGLPYYHNHTTGVTTWECPADYHGAPAAPSWNDSSSWNSNSPAAFSQAPAAAWNDSSNWMGNSQAAFSPAPAPTWNEASSWNTNSPAAFSQAQAATWNDPSSWNSTSPPALSPAPAPTWNDPSSWNGTSPAAFSQAPAPTWNVNSPAAFTPAAAPPAWNGTSPAAFAPAQAPTWNEAPNWNGNAPGAFAPAPMDSSQMRATPY